MYFWYWNLSNLFLTLSIQFICISHLIPLNWDELGVCFGFSEFWLKQSLRNDLFSINISVASKVLSKVLMPWDGQRAKWVRPSRSLDFTSALGPWVNGTSSCWINILVNHKGIFGVHHKHQPLPWIKSTLKIARYCPLVIQGFSNFLGLFQVIMAHPDLESYLGGGFKYFKVLPRSLQRWSNLTVAYFSTGLVQPPTAVVTLGEMAISELTLFISEEFFEEVN